MNFSISYLFTLSASCILWHQDKTVPHLALLGHNLLWVQIHSPHEQEVIFRK